MGTINIVKTIKLVHPSCMVIVKIGTFYNVYSKDAYIISYLLKYKIKEKEIIYWSKKHYEKELHQNKQANPVANQVLQFAHLLLCLVLQHLQETVYIQTQFFSD